MSQIFCLCLTEYAEYTFPTDKIRYTHRTEEKEKKKENQTIKKEANV